jgi:multimeric flavodoxin WrbA
MAKKILIISGSPNKNGNTQILINEFVKGAREKGSEIEVVHAASLKYKSNGCTSCRACQRSKEYECAINDEAKPVLKRMADVDVIVMATPLYFFSASAQLKLIFDRMFSLYKWDDAAGTMETPLKGKTFVLIGSAYEDLGLDALEAPFKITADYTGMPFKSLLIANAGASGDVEDKPDALRQAYEFGREIG